MKDDEEIVVYGSDGNGVTTIKRRHVGWSCDCDCSCSSFYNFSLNSLGQPRIFQRPLCCCKVWKYA